MSLALTIGVTDQTAFIAAGSMSVKLNTFDLALLNPAVLPEVGDAVVLVDPAWTGTVASVHVADTVQKGSHLTITLTATNTDEAEASAAPFGLSDTPDPLATPPTYGYRDLSVRPTHNINGTDTIEGELVCWQPGLWPAMTFELTAASRGYVEESFSITNVVMTWPTGKEANPVYQVSFGDPIVPMAVWVASQAANAPDGSISGTKITDRSIEAPKIKANTLTANEIGVHALTADCIDTEAIDFRTLGPSAHDVITAHVPNCMFVEAIAGLLPMGASKDDAAGYTANCPYWWVWRSSGTGTATVVADTAWPGGKYVECKFSATGSETTNNVALTTDKFPIIPGGRIGALLYYARNVPAGVTLNRRATFDFYTAAGAYISSQSIDNAYTTNQAQVMGTGPDVMAPDSARSARLTILCWETIAHDAATYYRLGAVFVTLAPSSSISSLDGFWDGGGAGGTTGGVHIRDTTGDQNHGLIFGEDTQVFRRASGQLRLPTIFLAGGFRPNGIIEIDISAADQNNWAPAGYEEAFIIAVSGVYTARLITGMVPPSPYYFGQAMYLLANVGGANITLKHQSASSTVGNRFMCPNAADLVLNAGDSVFVIKRPDYYDWWVVGT